MSRLAFVKRVWGDMLANGGVEKVLLPDLNILSAEPNKVVAQLSISKDHLNRLGVIHGGVLATLVDVGGSLSVASRGMFMTGVTTDLATTYLSAGGRPGDSLAIHCELQKLGRTMAFTFVELRDPRTQKLLARGNHTKYIANALKSNKNVTFD